MIIYNCVVIKGGRNILNKKHYVNKVLNCIFSLIFTMVSLSNNYWCTKVSAMNNGEEEKKEAKEEEKKEEVGDEETGKESETEEEEEENENIHECAIADFIKEGKLTQGATNWCLNTCLNLVYRDYLKKKDSTSGHVPPMVTELGEEPINEKFAELVFIHNNSFSEFNIPFIKFTPKTEFESAFAHMERRLADSDIVKMNATKLKRNQIYYHVVLKAFQTWIATLPVAEKKIEWDILPPNVRERLSTKTTTAKGLWNMITEIPDSAKEVKVNDVLKAKGDPWVDIFNEIWENKRPVILTTFQFGISNIGHAVLAFAAEEDEGQKTVYIYEPFLGKIIQHTIGSDFNPLINGNESPDAGKSADIFLFLVGYIKFDY